MKRTDDKCFGRTIRKIKIFSSIVNKYTNGDELISEEKDFIDFFEYELAKSLLLDNKYIAVRVAKLILSLED